MYIGIDLGTSSVKILLLDKFGRIKKSISKDYATYFPKNSWSEQNPEDWYKKTIEGLKDITENTQKDLIKGISFSGQMHGLVILDENDFVIRPAILWNDSRSVKETKYLNEVIGKNFLSRHTGNVAFSGFTAPKILWVKENENENFKKIKKIMLPKDYLAYKLSGIFCTDVSDASGTLLFDVENRCWSDEMINICEITIDHLPKIFESYEVVGNLKSDVANELGLSNEVKIIAGASDNAAAAIGSGTVGDNKCNISLGTSGTIFITTNKFSIDDNNSLHVFAHADGNYHLMGCILSGASCNKWWLEEILKTNDYDKEEKSIENLGKNKVFFSPYLMGERSPHNDENARASFIGMTMSTTRVDMYQSILEGVAFALRDSLEIAKDLGIKINRTRICGGGSKSNLWLNIIANVLNLEVETINDEHGPALGAAMLAAVGCGDFKNVSEISNEFAEKVKIIVPNDNTVQEYEAAYNKFKKIYPSLKDLYSSLI